MNSPYWFEVAVIFGICALGNIFFGHFEEYTPKWRRVAKPFVLGGVSVLISALAGRAWFFALMGAFTLAFAIIHGWWLPRLGINGWTAEPKEKYYALRGWKPK